MPRILFFDLETTGLPITRGFNNYYPYNKLEYYNPSRIVQLAFMIYDYPATAILTPTLLHKQDLIIKPTDFEIENSEIHGITKEIAQKKGVLFKDAIAMLMSKIKDVHLVVSHNILFDKNVLLSELFRFGDHTAIAAIDHIPTFCTSYNTSHITKLKYNDREYKQPKLTELYTFLFHRKPPQNMHNAMTDVKVLAECFAELIANQYFILA